MKITKIQLREIIREAILLEKFPKPNENDLAGRVMKWTFDGVTEQPPKELRDEKLNKIVDLINDAIKVVPHWKMKDFLWGLNHDFANGIKIEGKNFKMAEPQLRYVVRNVLFENQK
tara:strand:- start:576 stop:923 length:348 start_codon:yes stop_codon:yes gene_type:complete